MTTMIDATSATPLGDESAPRAEAIVRTGGSPGFVAPMGITVNILVRESDTNGRWAMFDYTIPGGFKGPRPHYHRRMEEAFYCISGAIALQVDGRDVILRAGEMAYVPPGVVHSFENASATEPAKILELLTPGGFERYYDALATLARNSPTWPPADPNALPALQEHFDHVAA